MIPFGSQRGYGDDLATHLMNGHDNERVSLFELRGSVAPDLHGAFAEWQTQGEFLTRCQNHFYSLSINPDQTQGRLNQDQYLDYVDRVEQALGLGGQPRAIVFHEKYGREHAHVIWSRIDVENERAIHIAFDREKLMRVTLGFARDHNLELPEGYYKRGRGKQLSLYDLEQERLTGLSKEQHTDYVTTCWQSSDSASAFVHALAEQGYLLATGKRPYVLVDLYGGQHALPRLIDDKQVRSKDVVSFLERDYPASDLPSVDEAKVLVAEHLAEREKNLKQPKEDRGREELEREHKKRIAHLIEEKETLFATQRQRLEVFFVEKRKERDDLRSAYLEQKREILESRNARKPAGIQGVIEKYTGIEVLKMRIHRHQDKKRLDEHGQQKLDLLACHEDERRALELRNQMEMREVDRRLGAAEKINARELASLARDNLRVQRIQKRLQGVEEERSLTHLLKQSEARDEMQRFRGVRKDDLDRSIE